MKIKITEKCVLSLLVGICLVLIVGVFTTKPIYASDKKPCDQIVEYLGFQTICYDSHCNQLTTYKHGQYLRYKYTDACTGYYEIKVFWDKCITAC